MSEKQNMLMTMGRQMKQGASLGFADEIQDVIGSAGAYAILKGMEAAGRIDDAPAFMDLVNRARQKSAEELQQDWQDNTATSLVGNIVGFLPFALGQSGTRAIMGAGKGSSTLTKSAQTLAKANEAIQGWAGAGTRAARAAKGAAVGAGYGAASGLGASEDDTWERIKGAIMGGGLGALTGGAVGAVSRGTPTSADVAQKAAKQVSFNKAEEDFMKDLLMRPDLSEMQKREAVFRALSKKTGIQLTLPERLAQTEIDPLLGQQAILAKRPETTGMAQQLLQQRIGEPLAGKEGQIVSAMQNTAQGMAKGSYDDLAQQLLGASKSKATEITGNLVKQARPYYQQAESVALPQDILADPVVADAVQTVFKNPAYMREIAPNTPESSIKVLDLAYKAIRDKAESSMRAGDRNAARLYGDAAQALVSKMDEAAPAYKTARSIYSSQPEALSNRELLGNLANIDELQPQKVVGKLYSGSVGVANKTAQALGPQNSKMAAAAKLQDIIGGLKTGNLPQKLDADTIAMLKTYAADQGQDVNDLLRVVEQARMGNRYLYGSQTQTNQSLGKDLQDAAAGAAVDIATGNKIGVIKKGIDIAKNAMGRANQEQYNKDMMNVFMSDRGEKLLDEAIKRHAALKMGKNAVVALPLAQSGSGSVARLSVMPDDMSAIPYQPLGGMASGIAAQEYTPTGKIIKAQEQEYVPTGIVQRRR